MPYVVLPLEPSPETSPPRGHWIRLLGEIGVTRHVVRLEEPDGFTLVGSDLLGFVDLKGLGAVLDAADVEKPEPPGNAAYERFVRYRARQYRWGPTDSTRPEGLRFASGSSGPRFDAGGLDGDALQAMVRRHRRVLRPVD